VVLCLRLAENVVTPTTKAADHDVPISSGEIVAQGLMSQGDWDTVRHPVIHPSNIHND
jgi:phosphoribosylaminoimidazole-succinocarboxamide synthase